MTPRLFSEPFRHVVIDGFASPRQLAEVNADWPAEDWPGWVRYGFPQQGKLASDSESTIPYHCSRLLLHAGALPIGCLLEMPDSVPDLTLWGGGLHEMRPGSELGLHLDADGHPRLGLRRAWTAVIYCHEHWWPGDGGELLLCRESGYVVGRIDPTPGRLVAFDCRDGWHAVTRLSDLAKPRRSLALFGYSPELSTGQRPRALFATSAKTRGVKP